MFLMFAEVKTHTLLRVQESIVGSQSFMRFLGSWGVAAGLPLPPESKGVTLQMRAFWAPWSVGLTCNRTVMLGKQVD